MPQAAEHLEPGGWLLIEVSPMIEPAVREMIANHGRFQLAPPSKIPPATPASSKRKQIIKPAMDRRSSPHSAIPWTAFQCTTENMDVITLHGGRPLRGTVTAAGSKNAALPIMAASILADEPVVLAGVPDVTDVNTLALGAGPSRRRSQTPRRQSSSAFTPSIHRRSPPTPNWSSQMRASFCVLGPLLARRGRAVVALPGGCQIGHRPIDLHLHGLAALGANIRIENGYVIAEAKSLHGAEMNLSGLRGPPSPAPPTS